jgi:hypothetical protein
VREETKKWHKKNYTTVVILANTRRTIFTDAAFQKSVLMVLVLMNQMKKW